MRIILTLLMLITLQIPKAYSQTWTYYTNTNWWFDEGWKGRNQTIIADLYGNLWIAPQNKGLWKFDILQNKFIAYTNLINDNIYSIFVEDEKSIWIGTETNGIYNFNGSSITKHFYNVIPNKIYDLLIDKNKNLIFTVNDSAWQGGIIMCDQNPDISGFIYCDLGMGFELRQLAIESNENRIIINNIEGPLNYVTVGIYSNFTGLPPSGGSEFYCYSIDCSNNRWVAVNDNAVYDTYLVRRGSSGNYDVPLGTISQQVYRVLIDNDNRILAANGDKGVYIYEGGSWTRYWTNNGLARPEVYALAQTMDGDYWFFHDDVISRCDIAGREGFQMTSFASNSGYSNSTSRYLKITGTGFKSGAKVKLKKAGSTNEILANDVQVIDNHTMLCRFNLTNAKTGTYHVLAYNHYRWPHFNYKFIKENSYEVKTAPANSSPSSPTNANLQGFASDLTKVYIYPNVIKENCAITFYNLPENAEIKLYNQIGNLLKEYKANKRNYEIDICDLGLSTGVYIAVIKDSKHAPVVKKILFVK